MGDLPARGGGSTSSSTSGSAPRRTAVGGGLLDDVDRRAVYLSEGLGHAFMALDGGQRGRRTSARRPTLRAASTACTRSTRDLGIDWPTTGRDGRPLEPLLSAKDAQAPTLAEVEQAGLLPSYDEAQSFLASLRA